MSVDMDEEEVTSEMNVDLLFNSQNTQDESSSSIEFPLKECDSVKKVTMSSLNEKLMSMWDFLQHQNEKQKKHKAKLSQTISQSLSQNQDELKQTLVQSTIYSNGKS
jgi:site-specific DNA-adenine methylase